MNLVVLLLGGNKKLFVIGIKFVVFLLRADKCAYGLQMGKTYYLSFAWEQLIVGFVTGTEFVVFLLRTNKWLWGL